MKILRIKAYPIKTLSVCKKCKRYCGNMMCKSKVNNRNPKLLCPREGYYCICLNAKFGEMCKSFSSKTN